MDEPPLEKFLDPTRKEPWIVQPVIWSPYTVHYLGSLTSDTAAPHNFKTWTIHTASHSGYTTLSTG